ncbi:PfkB family carbohydrate kinase [Psychromonas ossibalaenae]|uniref:PfkB family carbohydrate kinase n=1 Tax=Psychromonas ossibalaenae TaxID=444922 RepID=UPI00037202B7|nr:PfkB family carbohydrate kinase [Psychromonas ossibalaenae]
MANILLLANLNCDRVLQLDKPLTTGGRHHYRDMGRRLGGGGANTGLGLVFAGHHVSLVSQIGNDKTADWLLAEASLNGLDCHLLQRNDLLTPELLLLMTPGGERTIIRPQRPLFTLGQAPDFSLWNALYINSSAVGAETWAESALEHTLVVAQLSKDERPRPCHILISSKSDMAGRSSDWENNAAIWQYGQQIAGTALRYFIITDGENGAVAYQQDSQLHTAAVPAEVVDTTGAGDAFASGLINGLADGQDISQAMKQGAYWASIAVATDSSIPGEALQNFLKAL